ncbi:MAG: hypothetical protein ACKO96_04245, partial [Flammeovirgaceae bacterium]
PKTPKPHLNQTLIQSKVNYGGCVFFLLSIFTKLAIFQISHLRQHQVNKLFEVRIEVKLLFKPLSLIFCGMDRSDHLFKL